MPITNREWADSYTSNIIQTVKQCPPLSPFEAQNNINNFKEILIEKLENQDKELQHEKIGKWCAVTFTVICLIYIIFKP